VNLIFSDVTRTHSLSLSLSLLHTYSHTNTHTNSLSHTHTVGKGWWRVWIGSSLTWLAASTCLIDTNCTCSTLQHPATPCNILQQTASWNHMRDWQKAKRMDSFHRAASASESCLQHTAIPVQHTVTPLQHNDSASHLQRTAKPCNPFVTKCWRIASVSHCA